MKHLFKIEVQSSGNSLNNRKIFKIQVAGFAIIFAWPLPTSNIKLSHTTAPGSPSVLLRSILSISSNVSAKISSAVARVKARILGNFVLRGTQEITLRIWIALKNCSLNIRTDLVTVTARIRTLLSQSMSHEIKTAHSISELFTDIFSKLEDWDYLDSLGDTALPENRRFLHELDILTFEQMDKISEQKGVKI